MRKIALMAFLLIHLNSYSQELFVFTEPASNGIVLKFEYLLFNVF